jgi:hypothetical protein
MKSGDKVTVTKGMRGEKDAEMEVFYVRGCALYSSAGVTGKTAFCMFLLPYTTPDGLPGHTNSTDCRDGNKASRAAPIPAWVDFATDPWTSK